MVHIDVTCEICGKVFTRERGEVNRSKRLGRKVYCSRACTGIANIQNLPPKKVGMKNLRRGRVPDEYSPFREYLKLTRRRQRERNKISTITLEDLKQQWEDQNGICPLTGWQLEIPRTSRWDESPVTPRRASLDRIDPALGYIPGNIRFVAVIANYCKHQFTDEDVIEFCRAVVEHQTRQNDKS